MELKKNLDLAITLRDEEFSIDITEPESGEVISMTHYYAFDEHPSFNEDIGNELYSWLSLWKDEQEELCVANATTTPDEVAADYIAQKYGRYQKIADMLIGQLRECEIRYDEIAKLQTYIKAKIWKEALYA